MLTLSLTSFAHTEPHLRAHPAVTRRCCTTRRYALRSSPPLQTRALGPTRARVPRRAGLLLPPLQAQAAAAATATAETAATAVRVGAHGARRARSGGQRRIGPARRTRPQRGLAEVHTHTHTHARTHALTHRHTHALGYVHFYTFQGAAPREWTQHFALSDGQPHCVYCVALHAPQPDSPFCSEACAAAFSCAASQARCHTLCTV